MSSNLRYRIADFSPLMQDIHVFIHICACIYTYMYTYIYVYIYMYINEHMYMYLHMCVFMYIFIYIYIRIYICIHMNTYIHRYTYRYRSGCLYMYVDMHVSRIQDGEFYSRRGACHEALHANGVTVNVHVIWNRISLMGHDMDSGSSRCPRHTI